VGYNAATGTCVSTLVPSQRGFVTEDALDAGSEGIKLMHKIDKVEHKKQPYLGHGLGFDHEYVHTFDAALQHVSTSPVSWWPACSPA
jgi:hypothetical protein